MSVEKEIQKTQINSNNLKATKTKINESIVNGGGSNSATLSQVPNNLSNLIKKYRKVAKRSMNTNIPINDGRAKILFNTTFTPKIIYIKITNSEDREIAYINLSGILSEGHIYTDFRKRYGDFDRLHIYSISGGFEIYNQGSLQYYIKELAMIG